MFTESISYSAALLAGTLSFFSPCILPLIPAYFTFITGFTLDELIHRSDPQIKKKVILSTAAYVSGFSTVFILMGASASFMGGLIGAYRDEIRIVGGIMIILFGIHMTGLVRIRGLDFEKRLHVTKKPYHVFGSFIIGMAFAAGWSPCIGPLLGSVLIMAGSQETVGQGVILLSLYSLGLAIPFVLISIFINYIIVFIKRASKTLGYIRPIAGGLLIIMGLFLVTNKLYLLTG
jgi:cytochrome c-type biogenesis protein